MSMAPKVGARIGLAYAPTGEWSSGPAVFEIDDSDPGWDGVALYNEMGWTVIEAVVTEDKTPRRDDGTDHALEI